MPCGIEPSAREKREPAKGFGAAWIATGARAPGVPGPSSGSAPPPEASKTKEERDEAPKLCPFSGRRRARSGDRVRMLGCRDARRREQQLRRDGRGNRRRCGRHGERERCDQRERHGERERATSASGTASASGATSASGTASAGGVTSASSAERREQRERPGGATAGAARCRRREQRERRGHGEREQRSASAVAASVAASSSSGSGGATSGTGGGAAMQPFKALPIRRAPRGRRSTAWYYNWMQSENEPCSNGQGGEFIPMIWGHTGAEQIRRFDSECRRVIREQGIQARARLQRAGQHGPVEPLGRHGDNAPVLVR